MKHLPRAMGIGPLTMEYFRMWGLDSRVYEASLPNDEPGDIVYVTRICGYELARFPSPSPNAVKQATPELIANVPPLAHSPYYRTWCAQHALDEARVRMDRCVGAIIADVVLANQKGSCRPC